MIKKALILTGLSLLAFTGMAEAKPKFMGKIWWPSHWRDQDFQPYYEDSTNPHNSQWNDQELSDANWTPKEWVSMSGGKGNELLRQWYVAGILNDSYVKNGIPYMEVGPNFYHLGGADKRRVMETVDAVYGVTTRSPKMFLLKDWRTDRIIGEYSKTGLVLQ